MHKQKLTDKLEPIHIVKSCLVAHKERTASLTETGYSAYIVSISETLAKVQNLLKQNDVNSGGSHLNVEKLADLIGIEALKQGMAIHFDVGKKIS